ncbi:TonB-dependent receptor [Limibacter armeniacum]|uniref:SusC/RagA family TonB-linked outer membrane protein n=1 Tax=Limibacter armeniacum TaxID=466084 RepID=UPI002FE53B66
MAKKIFLSLALLPLLTLAAFAQDRTITGNVSEAGEPLPGVTVLLKGTTTGTITDFEGNYTIKVPSNESVLIFRFLGYQTQEIVAGAQSAINVSLVVDAEELEEVEVVGYTKKDVSSSTPTVENVTDITAPNMATAMQGKAAGINITPPSGQPGAKANIRIRGVGSISAGTDPLYVIDGVIMSSDDGIAANQQQQRDPLASISPEDIQDIKILKDAAATALYGARAANGVILVTTKRGSSGKPTITFSTRQGISRLNKGNLEYANGKEFAEFHGEEWNGTDTDWIDKAFRDGYTQSYDVSMSGGNDQTKYYASAGYYNQEGILIGSGFERYSLRMNLDQKVSDRVNVSLNTSLSQIDQLDASNGNLYSSPLLGSYLQAPTVSPYDEDGNPRALLNDGAVQANFLHDTPLNSRKTKSLNGVLDGKINVLLTDWLTASNTTALRFENADYTYFSNPSSYDGRSTNGSLVESHLTNSTLTSTSLLNFDKTFGGVHEVSGILGYEYQENNRSLTSMEGTQFPDGLSNMDQAAQISSIGGSKTSYKYLSYLSQVAYNYDGKYYASASFRRDGSSKFSKENQYGNFWSVGGSWFISREDFMMDSPLTLAKIRASYGTTGNANIGDFEARGLYGYDAYNKLPAAYYEQLENEDLTWEIRHKFNAGFDVSYKDVITLNADFYVENSKDLLLEAPLQSTTGFSIIRRNVGEVQNKGVELQLSTNNLKGEFEWNTAFNIAFNKNKVLKLDDDQSSVVDGIHIIEEGKSIYTFYLREFAGANPANGESSWYVNNPDLTEQEVNKMLESDEYYMRDGRLATSNFGSAKRVDSGSALPDFTGGLTNNFKYKNFDLSIFMTFSVGGKIYNGTKRFTELFDGAVSGYAITKESLGERWEQPGDMTYLPAYGTGSSTYHSDRILEDGSYLSLRNITLGYTVPSSLAEKLHLTNIRLFASAQNLFTISDYSGYSPVTVDADGYNFFEYPEGRMFTGGVTVKF